MIVNEPVLSKASTHNTSSPTFRHPRQVSEINRRIDHILSLSDEDQPLVLSPLDLQIPIPLVRPPYGKRHSSMIQSMHGPISFPFPVLILIPVSIRRHLSSFYQPPSFLITLYYALTASMTVILSPFNRIRPVCQSPCRIVPVPFHSSTTSFPSTSVVLFP
jgi:hypothetical protein